MKCCYQTPGFERRISGSMFERAAPVASGVAAVDYHSFDAMISGREDILDVPLENVWEPNTQVRMSANHQDDQPTLCYSSQPLRDQTIPASTSIVYSSKEANNNDCEQSGPWCISALSRASPGLYRQTDFISYSRERPSMSSNTSSGLSSPIGAKVRSSSPFDDTPANGTWWMSSTPSSNITRNTISHRHPLPYSPHGASRENPTCPHASRRLSSEWDWHSPPESVASTFNEYDRLSTSVNSLTLESFNMILNERTPSTDFFRRSHRPLNPTSSPSFVFASGTSTLPTPNLLDNHVAASPALLTPTLPSSTSTASAVASILDHASKAPGSSLSWSAVVKSPTKSQAIPMMSNVNCGIISDQSLNFSTQTHSHNNVGSVVPSHEYKPSFRPLTSHQPIMQNSTSRGTLSSARLRDFGPIGDRKGLLGITSSPSNNRYISPSSVDTSSRRRMNETMSAREINPTHKQFNCKPTNARYFVIKSYTEDDVHKSLKYSIWASTDIGNRRLHQAFQESAHSGPIYLFFSVNASGHFCGMAEMMTPVDWGRSSNVWLQGQKYRGTFGVRWIFVKDIPNSALRHLRCVNNENKPVTNSRDTQELQSEIGCEMLKVLAEYRSKTSLLDDFSWYDQREEDRRVALDERSIDAAVVGGVASNGNVRAARSSEFQESSQ